MRIPTLALPFLTCLLFACKNSPEGVQTGPQTAAKTTTTASVKPEDKSVKPGINKRFKDPEMDLAKAKETFEGESREIFVHRAKIAKILDLQPGQSVADIGSGTGLFLPYFAQDVGSQGKVYAVEISPRFIEHLGKLAEKKGWSQVETVYCTDRDTRLPANSTDLAYICDTYHHFEYPHRTMTSLFRAMRPGGTVVIVDFERIPGVSRKWVLGHVRCGKETVIQEVEATGFRYVDEVKVDGLKENYLIRFRRP